MVYRGKVEIHLPGKLRLERNSLELHIDKTPQCAVIEKQIQSTPFPAYLYLIFIAHVEKILTQLKDELLHVFPNARMQLVFGMFFGQAKEIQQGTIFQEEFCRRVFCAQSL